MPDLFAAPQPHAMLGASPALPASALEFSLNAAAAVPLRFPPPPASAAAPPRADFSLPIFYTHAISRANATASGGQGPVLQLPERMPPGARTRPLGRAAVMSCRPVMQELLAQARALRPTAEGRQVHKMAPSQARAPRPAAERSQICNMALSQAKAPRRDTSGRQQHGMTPSQVQPRGWCSDVLLPLATLAHTGPVNVSGTADDAPARAAANGSGATLSEPAACALACVATEAPVQATADAAAERPPSAAAQASGPYGAEARAPASQHASSVSAEASPGRSKRARAPVAFLGGACDGPAAPQSARTGIGADYELVRRTHAQDDAHAGQRCTNAQPGSNRRAGVADEAAPAPVTAAWPSDVIASASPHSGSPVLNAATGEVRRERNSEAQHLGAPVRPAWNAAQLDKGGRASDSEWEVSDGGESLPATDSATLDGSATVSYASVSSGDDACEVSSVAQRCLIRAQRAAARRRAVPVREYAVATSADVELQPQPRGSPLPAGMRAKRQVIVQTAPPGCGGEAAYTCTLCRVAKPQCEMPKACASQGGLYCKECTCKVSKLRRSGYSATEAAAAAADGSADKVQIP